MSEIIAWTVYVCITLFILLIIAVAYLVSSILVTEIWNALLHDLLGLPMLEWFNTLALLIMVSIVGGAFKK